MIIFAELFVALLKQGDLFGAQPGVVGMRCDFFANLLQFLTECSVFLLELIKLRLLAHGLIKAQISRQCPATRLGRG